MPDRMRAADSWRPALLTAAAAVAIPVIAAILVVAAVTQDAGWATLRAGVRVWLVAIGAGLHIGETSISLVPLGGVLAAGAIAAAVAARQAHRDTPDAVVFGAVAGAGAGVLAATLSAATSVGSIGTSFVRAAFGAFVVVGVSAAIAVAIRVPGSFRLPAWSAPMLPAVRAGIRAGALILGYAATLVAVLAAFQVRRAGDLWAALDPGIGGGVALALVSLMSLPTIVAWASAALIGPGFALGTDTSVSMTGVDVAALPAFPPLAVIPSPGPFPDLVVVLMVVPVLLAGCAGWRWVAVPADTSLWTRVALGAGAGAVAGVIVGLVAATGRGAVGPGLLADVGPPILSTAGIAIVSWALAGAIGGALGHYRGLRADQE
ncbi:DUF6350 family protein [Aeromicrobium piscarium]|uniref:Uncharacterized protein n=1 Tax=Aeromicrobium piscarium TaxID=2590901 RepID=A0A554SPX4_9ACTN|nr:DUF6350 family protein [Aeromicrobium piscarium]TSD68309.1 hypothetical protein FNM00_01565 [Aeromicrobium piscarium]